MAHTLVFARHATTDLAGTFCGSSDPPLNQAGCAEAHALAERLREAGCVAVYTSGKLRARQTAECVASTLGLPVHVRPGLRELCFGAWEGMRWEEIERHDPVTAARWVTEFPAMPAPGGEPIPAFRQRVMEEIGLLRQEAERGGLVIVTHAAVLRVLLEELGHFAPHHAWERTRDYTCTIRCVQEAARGDLRVDC